MPYISVPGYPKFPEDSHQGLRSTLLDNGPSINDGDRLGLGPLITGLKERDNHISQPWVTLYTLGYLVSQATYLQEFVLSVAKLEILVAENFLCVPSALVAAPAGEGLVSCVELSLVSREGHVLLYPPGSLAYKCHPFTHLSLCFRVN